MSKVLIIGCGTIGQGFLEIWNKQNHEIVVIDPLYEKIKVKYSNILFFKDLQSIPKEFNEDFCLLSVKPNHLKELEEELKKRNSILLSVLAGISIEKIKTINANSVRVMPNVALKMGESINLVLCDELIQKNILELLKPTGKNIILENETYFNELTAIFGCGPAFLLLMLENFYQLTKKCKINDKEAKELVDHLFKGSLSILEDKSYQELMDSVACKGGATEAGLLYMKPPLQEVMNHTIKTAVNKMIELQKDNS